MQVILSRCGSLVSTGDEQRHHLNKQQRTTKCGVRKVPVISQQVAVSKGVCMILQRTGERNWPEESAGATQGRMADGVNSVTTVC